MPQRTLTLDALMMQLAVLRHEHGGETLVYIDDANTRHSLGIMWVAFYETGEGERCWFAPPGIYLSGDYYTEEA